MLYWRLDWYRVASVRNSLFPSATTTAAKVKAMGAVLAEKGTDVLGAWHEEVGIGPDDYQDERILISLATVRRAAKGYAARVEWDPWEQLARALIAPNCIGWLEPLVRNVTSLADALVRLGKDVDDGATLRATLLDASNPKAQWQHVNLRLTLEHEPSLEEGGWLAHVREAEASAVVRYFGETATVTAKGDQLNVTWRGARPTWLTILSLLFPALLIAFGLSVAARWVLWVGVFQLAIGSAGAYAYQNHVKRRAAALQQNRAALLERVLVLKETKPTTHEVGDFSGQTIAGRYRVLNRLGTGGSGAVYLATRLDDSLHVAVKLLRAGAAHDGGASDRLRREAEALGLAWHPNVVEVFDHGRLPDGTSYMVMEYLEGETLQECIDRGGALTLAAFAPIFEKILGALAAIHAAGIVHRDLKPDNVFLLKDGNVKVFDFGIARVEWEEMRLTGQGTPLGTQGYTAPEQLRGEEVDGRADIYSLGVLGYVALTAKSPSTPRSWGAVDRALVELFESTLAEDRDTRPQNPKGLLETFRMCTVAP